MRGSSASRSTFQQNAASFALARRLKERFPRHRHRVRRRQLRRRDGPGVGPRDRLHRLRGDRRGRRRVPRAAGRAGRRRRTRARSPGVARRRDGAGGGHPARPPLRQLDDLPTPDYTEYFERAERARTAPPTGQRRIWIPFESARGCWWGAKHHCTFCGLNGTTMQFRSKSPQRVADELADAGPTVPQLPLRGRRQHPRHELPEPGCSRAIVERTPTTRSSTRSRRT